MKPDAMYVFEKHPELKTYYILKYHYGIEIVDFPAIWTNKSHNHVGEKYIVFRKTMAQRPRQWFTYSLSLENNRMLTSFNFPLECQRLAWGDYRDYAILIEFSDDWTSLTLLFFKEMKNHARLLFESGLKGELTDIVETDIQPLSKCA